jgi:methylmalonyl-CoA/ethylmalonyl-CoA epimerase
MLGRLNHVAIAVKDLAAASALYRNTLGAAVSAPQALPEHGVTVVFIELPNTKIELLEPLGEASPIAKFLEKNSDGGIHHICYEVEDILAARDRLMRDGARVLGSGEPRQARAVPASQGFLRRSCRAGAGVRCRSARRSRFISSSGG